MAGRNVAQAYKAWPMWARVAAPVGAGILAIGALAPTDDEEPEPTTTTAAEFDAITVADASELVTDTAGLSGEEIEDLIESTCEADPDQLAEDLVDHDVAEEEVQPLLEGLGEAAQEYCPEVVAEAPSLLNDANTAAISMLVAATSTTAAPTTTVPPTTAPPTTAAPPPPPPPPPPPTTAAPPPPPPPSPDVYFANCDAARAAGAAPLYRGDPGYRSGLDRDNDGVACE